MRILSCFAAIPIAFAVLPCAADELPNGWIQQAAREEIRPQFSYEPTGGPENDGVLVLAADHREGLSGHWETSVPVVGDRYFEFSVNRKTDGMATARRSAIARVRWVNDSGKSVVHKDVSEFGYRRGERPRAEPEFPLAILTTDGWTKMAGVYLSPPDATKAIIELHFRWGEPNSTVRWTLPQLVETKAPERRTVRLATVHYQPREGESSLDKCRQFAPFIRQAAGKKRGPCRVARDADVLSHARYVCGRR